MQNQSANRSITTPKLEIVDKTNNRPQVELEIEKHISHIRSLINKLHPYDRRKYFDGFLTHLLGKQVVYPPVMKNTSSTTNEEHDLSVLNNEELLLIKELSYKMEEMYRSMGDTIE